MSENNFSDSFKRHYKKGTILLHQGEKSKYTYQVISGCLKSYVTDDEGKEHILQFAPEDWLIGDMDSNLNGVPAVMTIEVIEDSEVLLLASLQKSIREDMEKEQILHYLKKLENRMIANNKRLIHLLSATAEERYLDFIETYPTLYQRLPLKLIASYLGMTPEFLSRIRKNLIEKFRK